MAERKLKVMFHAMEGTGHFNACIGFGQILQKRGHEIIFAINETLVSKVESFGFRALPLKQIDENADKKEDYKLSENPAKDFAQKLKDAGLLSNKTALEKIAALKDDDDDNFMEVLKKLCIVFNPQIERFLEQEKPDVWIHDHFMILPAVLKSKIPWMVVCSGAPLMYYQSKILPPQTSGLPSNDKSGWKEFQTVLDESLKHFMKYQHEINEHFGYVPGENEFTIPSMTTTSPFLNIYQYPLELDYTQDGFKVPDNFVGVDAFVRQEPEKFELPEDFNSIKTESDKKIYLSLGSMGSFDIDLMQRILSILAKLPYKVIVSKGPRGDEYELPTNCWGKNFLPQPEIVEIVDVVITHGGNNTFTETFAAGKPMIVMPLFGDQYDNAQRVDETGYGVRIEPYDFEEQQLVDAIEKLMNSKEIAKKMHAAKERISTSTRRQEAAIRVEEVIAKSKQ